ncbi:unnamed protein product [Mytilus edulis]|uniref:Uncharacterized protein n=1 Tax=Mytilus edulis TaxID=6550 RepID=A0A8S3VE22_MYTED|nr:unnamed protein product [Mytilus edulis]
MKSPDDKTSNIDFIIEIPDDYLDSYFERFTKDWLAGKVAVVFSNNNMKVSSFRQRLIQYLQQLDQLQQVKLANTKDTVEPKRAVLQRNPDPCDHTPLSTSYVNNNISISNSPSLVQPLMKHKPDVNAQTYDGVYSRNDENHPTGTLEKLEQNIFDTLVKSTASRVTEYVSQKSVDYAFDVVAGSMGRKDVVNCLLDHNANINQKKKMEQHHYFMHVK